MAQDTVAGGTADGRGDLVTRISGLLTDEILGGRFAAGSRLTEAQLAKDLAVSRAPVREALRRLENRGLVIAHPRRGFFVRDLNADAYDQIFDLRLCLERHAGNLVIDRLAPEIADALQAQYDNILLAARDGMSGKLIEEDLEFHRLMCRFSGNERLLQVYEELADEVRFGIAMLDYVDIDPMVLALAHEPLLKAVRSADKAAYLVAIDDHLNSGCVKVVNMLRERCA